MSEKRDWLDDLLEQVASGRMLPQDALSAFFMHKRDAAETTLTQEDHAFITAMDAAETAQLVAKWCARHAAALGGVTAIAADLRGPSLLHPRRRPPMVTGTDAAGRRVMLFSAADTAQGGEYGDDCLRVGGSFSGIHADPVFLPVFMSALTTALKGHGLPEPACTT